MNNRETQDFFVLRPGERQGDPPHLFYSTAYRISSKHNEIGDVQVKEEEIKPVFVFKKMLGIVNKENLITTEHFWG